VLGIGESRQELRLLLAEAGSWSTVSAPDVNPLRFCRTLLAPAVLVGVLAASAGRAQTAARPRPVAADENPGAVPDRPVLLDQVVVDAAASDDDYDTTGMGSLEAELRAPPFANDLVRDQVPADDLTAGLELELNLIATPSPVELATGTDRVNLRGFPTPRLRDGFAQTGIPEVLNVERRETIQGALTPVAGRAAPGGIQNHVTGRPPAKSRTRTHLGYTSEDIARVRFETGGPIGARGEAAKTKRRHFHRVALAWERRDGPEAFAYQETLATSAALTIRHSRSASTMVQVDYQAYAGNPSPGIPEYRASRDQPIVGRYLPLADFHTYGPEAGVRRRTGSASVAFDGQLSPALTLRAMVQTLRRELDEDRFTKGEYLLDVARFGGTREPQHIEQPLTALAAEAALTARFARAGIDHKILFSAQSVRTRYEREHRGLETSDRNALPLDVRQFDPYAPNFWRPAYSPDLYRRLITDRREDTRYTGLALSERAAFRYGRLVATAGLRYDRVSLDLDDRRPNASRPHVDDATAQVTYHAGGNLVAVPNRLLLYANTSTAFEPSTRVDARTGRIQGNATTRGVELGVRGTLWARRVTYAAHGFTFVNENISRRNPLYNDPILDPLFTQPELVAAGEERFSGVKLDIRSQLTPAWQLVGNVTYTDAVTTRSPDLPQEEGRPLARLPRIAGGATARYQVREGTLAGLSLHAGATYIGEFVQNYADTNRVHLEYPGYTLVSAGAGYRWSRKKAQHHVSVSVRNLLDADLLARLARPGAGRELGMNYERTF
jgi:iron complex outermembrane recepter protein